MRLFVGTSGYSYKEWKGSFYPEKITPKEMLPYYSLRFSTVELNNTFYRMPTASMAESWAQQTPDSFRFAMKAPQKITHHKRLKDVDEEINQFLEAATVLKERQGPLLVQLPPNLKKNIPLLQDFLSKVGNRAALAFEFRHESWHDDEVFECLRQTSCALCAADTDEDPNTELVSTSTWGYVRLRRVNYTKPALRKWLDHIQSQVWSAAYVFFKHEDAGTGPKFAAKLLELTAQ